MKTMTCKQLEEKLDDYLDQTLDDKESVLLDQHKASCGDCQRIFDRQHRLRALLREYGDLDVPTPNAHFFDQALASAARAAATQQRKRSWRSGFASAIAAGLAIWFVSAVLINTPDTDPPVTALPGISMTLEEPRTINLVFSSAIALDDATLTVTLPAGVELQGFEGQRQVSWRTSLKEGRNLLPLRLVATMPTEGVLLATLRHGEDDREFRLLLNVS
jgi:anti-sigma factor RsiW